MKIAICDVPGCLENFGVAGTDKAVRAHKTHMKAAHLDVVKVRKKSVQSTYRVPYARAIRPRSVYSLFKHFSKAHC